MVKKLRINNRPTTRRFNEARRSIEVVTFDELTDEQKDKVVKDTLNGGGHYHSVMRSFSVSENDYYEYRKDELVEQLEADTSLSVDGKKLYWNSNSQGWYPEWRLSDVFGQTDIDNVTIDFYGGSLRGTTYVAYDESTEEYEEFDTIEELSNSGLADATTVNKVKETISKIEEFLSELDEIIRDYVDSYPDYDFIYEELENNDFYEFTVYSDGTVKAYLGG